MADEPSGVSIWTPKLVDEALVRKFVSLNGSGYVAIAIQDSTKNPAVPVDPDPGTLALAVWFNDVIADPAPNAANPNPYGTQVLTVTADSISRVDTGQYYYDLGPGLTANRGLITCVWTYQVNGTAFQFTDHLQVLDPMPLYDSLTPQEKSVVEQVSWMFGDLYDSTEGGPHLIEEFQTHWNYERIAQMMRIAVTRMNFIGNYGNAPTTWTVGTTITGPATVTGWTTTTTVELPNGTKTTTTITPPSSTSGSSSVPDNMLGLAVLGTYIECMRHFRDSYTELPNRPGMDVTYTDRTQYWQRWNANLQAEQQNWEQQVKRAKMSLLNMSNGALLVAGGIFGGSALGVFQAGTYAAQVRSWRFYPAAPAISFGATVH